MLASDLNNPEFVNPQNPDKFLHVQFYWDTPLDKNKTERATEDAGKYVAVYEPKKLLIRIQKPGDLTSVIETFAREDHKRRFPDHWKAFQIQEGLLNEDIPGWKIEEWGELSKEEVERLKFLRFLTVEQIALASDAQCQGIGMGAEGLRIRAREALKNRIGDTVNAAMAEKDAQIAALKKSDEEKEERLRRLEAALLGQPRAVDSETVARAEGAPRRGRPKKTTEVSA